MPKRGNGEGSITRHKKSGLYMARYTVETAAGPKRKTIYGKERDEVRDKLIDALSNRNKGLVFEGDDQTLSAFLEAVMNSMRNGLGMRKTGDRRKPGQPDNPHSNAVFTQVHNTL